MATYSTRNRLVKQATNENLNTWGTTLNGGMIDMVDEAMDGMTSLSMSGNVTLTDEDGATDQSRNRLLNITSTGGANRTITIPAVEKWYIVRNGGAQRVTVKTASGTGVIVPPSVNAIISCDGTNCARISQSGYGFIESVNYSAVTVDLTLTGYDYKNFLIVIKGASTATVGAGSAMSLRVSNDGVTYSTTGCNVSLFAATGDTFYGAIEFVNATADAGMFTSGLVNCPANLDIESDQLNPGSDVGRTPTAAVNGGWRCTGGVKYVRLTMGGGHNFDAGTFEIWGK